MLPNISPPIDRSETAMQGVQYRGPQQAYRGTVEGSNILCTICKKACDLLAPAPRQLCLVACDNTVC